MAQDRRVPARSSGQGELPFGTCEVRDWRVWPESMAVQCGRCGLEIVGLYWLTEHASPAHWECLTDEERVEREEPI